MDFKDGLAILSDRVSKLKENIATEEAAKTAFVLPFIQNLGYDIFNPIEVIPECDCDYGTKKGEKIDYTICKDGEPIILIECKHWKEDLSKHQAQLFRYFHVSKAKFGVLTNGIIYKFFTDLEEQNKMDEKPFFEINMLDLKDSHIEKLKEFHQSYFNLSSILTTANELKYTNAIKNYLASESVSPSNDFVKFVTKQVYTGTVTKNVLEQFSPMVKRAFLQFTNDYVNDRLKLAITPDVPTVEKPENEETAIEQTLEENKITTTEDELQGYYIVKAILGNNVDINRITYRDAQTYFAILLDDNNRKPVCRLHFNGTKKYIETFDFDKKGTKNVISAVSDIYGLSQQLIDTIGYYTL